mgnify:CR=1 FL=1
MNNQIYNGSDHKTIGPPERDSSDIDITDWRSNKAEGCEYLFTGECHWGEDMYGEFCCNMEQCPDGRW